MKSTLCTNKIVPEIIRELGHVSCTQKAIEHVLIRNLSENDETITVVPFKEEKIVYGRVRVSPTKILAPPRTTARFRVTYLSYVENLTDLVSYDIYEDEKLHARLHVVARSLGPSISCKTYYVKLFRFRDVNQVVRNVALENVTKCEAKFFFDMDEDYKFIRISQTHGVIPPESKVTLKISTASVKPGVYCKTIFCLIQSHPPLIFNIVSLCQPKLNLEPKNIVIKHPQEIRHTCTYEAYMDKLNPEILVKQEPIPQKGIFKECLSDASMAELEGEICWSDEENEGYPLERFKIKKSSIKVYLSLSHLDIKNHLQSFAVTALVNFSKCLSYYYEWDKDPKEIFSIQPIRGTVEPNSTAYFNVIFSPPDPDVLYHIELDVRIYFSNCDVKVSASDPVFLPQTKSLKIIGHSFRDGSCGWLAQCSIIPKSLQLRACVPNEIVYGTFMIERRGHLPISFSVVPSKDMTYSVQPPIGFLSKEYQIFVIKFNGKAKEGVYTEDLEIAFNDTDSNSEILKLATSVEIPNLVFNENNLVIFKPTFPGAQNSEPIVIRNTTNLYLGYEFIIPDDITWCEVINPKGEISPKFSLEIIIIFKPNIPYEYDGSIFCSVFSTSKTDFVRTLQLHLRGSCQYGYLVATPSTYDYGECLYLEQKSIKLHLYNFSPVLINFKLTPVHRAFPVGNVESDVVITPNRGFVPGKSFLVVEVAVTPHGIDVFQYAILCQNLQDNSPNSPTCEDPRIVFTFRFEGVLPSIQVIDLNLENGGQLFSPSWVWKMMNINKLNIAFNSLEEEMFFELRFPEAPLKTSPISLAMLIVANRHGVFTCDIHKKIMCPCFVASDENVNETCLHARSAWPPKSVTLRPNTRLLLQFYISFEQVSRCSFNWILHLPCKRTIFLAAQMVTLPMEDRPLLSIYLHPVFHLQSIFIGDINPPLQLFWLYNNNFTTGEYEVTDITLKDNSSNVEQIFRCINPKGNIPPLSSLPLAFLFTPNEIKLYKAQVVLRLHESKTEVLVLEGEGIANFQPYKELSYEKNISKEPFLSQSDVDLYCSLSYINIDFQRTFSRVKRIFFMKNKSVSATWSFHWHTFKVNNVLFAHMHPSGGRIKPEEKIFVTLVLESFGYPAQVNFSIPCDVIEYSALAAHEEAARKQEVMKEKTKEYFTITEKGITFENPRIPIPKKPSMYHIFFSGNVNIISVPNIDTKLRNEQQMRLQAESGLETKLEENLVLKSAGIVPVLQVLEKTLWTIMNNGKFWDKVKCHKNCNDFKYLQLLPDARRKYAYNTTSLQRSQIQSFLAKEFKDILSRSVICENSEPYLKFYEGTDFNVFQR